MRRTGKEREADKKVSREAICSRRGKNATIIAREMPRVVVTSHHPHSVFRRLSLYIMRVDSLSGTATEVDDGDDNQHLSRCFDKINAAVNSPRHFGRLRIGIQLCRKLSQKQICSRSVVNLRVKVNKF